MGKYSKIYYSEGNKFSGFRYNYECEMLEWVTKWSMVWDDSVKEYRNVVGSDWEVVSCIYLSKDDWEDNPDYWVERYEEELDKKAEYLSRYL